ncbi:MULTISPECIES: 4'-phosphopantetheinyl transferase superfamily protein [unclassified Caballeronia]|uniref:4'-phosphopantetheinyl transferase family protein n=1 Tax=unclassified Caballeronia TaxID=2646786 RepID=UPI00285CC912|nr:MULTISPECIES: 4'-phosphopantetheinyl transferase superfamily protein [unclassified Caballeronia]MDR5776815.1 4'-phosphopantetheinyl transferase superfamily protein [Caballeronia sp. LZ002]MDR5798674.1 4'-phosphopantetheinyl transferase superfamily protein [Caballeronia sp. LZ001]MDR5852255.1 4'-phosphopantetheinyl transferase superfamily protein [Caballeronia sp. LZ003]
MIFLPAQIDSLPLPPDVPDDLQVWAVSIDLSASFAEAQADVLSPAERFRAKSYLRHVDAMRFVTVRAALRIVLSKLTNQDPESLIIENNEFGRPTLRTTVGIDFNVSHSGSYGAIALSTKRRVGIDLEQKNMSLDWRELAPSVLESADYTVVSALPEDKRIEAFATTWVGKEAILKAHGTGIAAPDLAMETFSVLPIHGGAYSVSAPLQDYAAIELGAPEHYVAALAWSIK